MSVFTCYIAGKSHASRFVCSLEHLLPAPVQSTARKGRVNDVGFVVQLKKHVKEAAARKFGSDVKLIDRILELEVGVKSVVFGTLYKDMKVSQTHTLSQTYSLSLSHTHIIIHAYVHTH